MECAPSAAPLKCARAAFRASCTRAALLALALLLLAVGCASTKRRTPAPSEPDPAPTSAGPAWVREPLSWEKLEGIEAWLARSSAGHDPGLVREAQLQLHEGRLEFSRRDLEAGTAPAAALRVRLESAEEGFEEVSADPGASPGQRARARVGIQGVRALLDVPSRSSLQIVRRAQWGATPARPSSMNELRGAWSRITVHHSAESSSDPAGGSLQDSASTVSGIQRYHMEDPEHRWGDIGYHFLIDSAGRIFEGRDLRWQGAHVRGPGGNNNHQNLGICLLGDFAARSPTPAALQSLDALLDDLRERYRIPPGRVYTHSDFVTTGCPGPALQGWIERYRR